MSDKIETYGLAPGNVKGPMLDKGQWPTFFDWTKDTEGETVVTLKSGFRLCLSAPAVHADKSADQSIPSATDTIVIFDSVLYDNYKAFGIHSGIFIVPVDGLYSFHANVQWKADTWVIGQNISLWLVERKTNLKYGGVFHTLVNATSYAYGAAVSVVIPARKGDQLCVVVRHTNAAARIISAAGDFNCITIAKVGDL